MKKSKKRKILRVKRGSRALRAALFVGSFTFLGAPAPGQLGGGCGSEAVPASAATFCQAIAELECERQLALGENIDLNGCYAAAEMKTKNFVWPAECSNPTPDTRQTKFCIDQRSIAANINTETRDLAGCQFCVDGCPQ